MGPFVKTPTFFIEEQFDSWGIWSMRFDLFDDDQEYNSLTLDYANLYGKESSQEILDLGEQHGFFMTSMLSHCGATATKMEYVYLD